MGCTDFWAEVALARAENTVALLALWCVAGDDDVADLDGGDTLAEALHDGGGFVAEDAREEALGVVTVQCVDIGVAEGIGDYLDADFALFGWGHVDVLVDEGLFRAVGDCSLAENGLRCFHLHPDINILKYGYTKYDLMSDGLPILNHDFLESKQSLFADCLILALFGLLHDEVLDLHRLNDTKYQWFHILPAMRIEPTELPQIITRNRYILLPLPRQQPM